MECSFDTIRHMRLNDNQKQMLYQAFGKYGLTPQQFEIFEDDYEICFEHKVESSYRVVFHRVCPEPVPRTL